MGVILDVVYNHLGPDGNYLKEFADIILPTGTRTSGARPLTSMIRTAAPVREFFATNAKYWIDEYHLDGLRLDATQQIYDCSEGHILTVIARSVREAAKGRSTFSLPRTNASTVGLFTRRTKAVMAWTPFGMKTFTTPPWSPPVDEEKLTSATIPGVLKS